MIINSPYAPNRNSLPKDIGTSDVLRRKAAAKKQESVARHKCRATKAALISLALNGVLFRRGLLRTTLRKLSDYL